MFDVKLDSSVGLPRSIKQEQKSPGGRKSSADKKRRVAPQCTGCRDEILDRYILRILPDQEWHVDCLKCGECGQQLDESWTCFVRDNKPYCRNDYAKLFGMKCARCACVFCDDDLVMRAGHVIYHIDCFRCVTCGRRLVTGEEFALRDQRLFCKDDHEAVEHTSGGTDNGTDLEKDEDAREADIANNNNNTQSNKSDASEYKEILHSPASKTGHTAAGSNTHRSGHGRGSSSRSHKSDQKTTRIRTVLNEKQLHTLRTCYAANPRPDALMKEQLTEMTGLNSRVVRVWFQNKRCKDKKRSILLKQIQQQQIDKGDDCEEEIWASMCRKGIPMIATSPMCHEPPPSSMLQLTPVEIHQYPSPWKALSDFALQSDLDQPSLQRLVRSFGESSGDDEDYQHDDDTVVSFDEPTLRGRVSHKSRSGADHVVSDAASRLEDIKEAAAAAAADHFQLQRMKQQQQQLQQLHHHVFLQQQQRHLSAMYGADEQC